MNNVTFIAPDLNRLEGSRANALALFCFEEKRPFRGITSLVDWRLLGHLSMLSIEGFLTGGQDETLLVPLGNRLPQDHLMVFGLGERAGFSEDSFSRAITRMFETATRMKCGNLALSLPGRAEGVAGATDAIGWFMDRYQEAGDDREMLIIEPSAAQKEMIPVVERWRLKRLVP